MISIFIDYMEMYWQITSDFGEIYFKFHLYLKSDPSKSEIDIILWDEKQTLKGIIHV